MNSSVRPRTRLAYVMTFGAIVFVGSMSLSGCSSSTPPAETAAAPAAGGVDPNLPAAPKVDPGSKLGKRDARIAKAKAAAGGK